MISGATVSLNPVGDFKPNVSYYVLISPTALKNSAGINFEGIQNKNIFQFKIRKKTPKEEFSEVKDDVGAKMTANTTKQIRNFATATSAVVTAARSRAITNRSRSSGSISTNRSSNGSQEIHLVAIRILIQMRVIQTALIELIRKLPLICGLQLEEQMRVVR